VPSCSLAPDRTSSRGIIVDDVERDAFDVEVYVFALEAKSFGQQRYGDLLGEYVPGVVAYEMPLRCTEKGRST